jgi:aconitate hydratase
MVSDKRDNLRGNVCKNLKLDSGTVIIYGLQELEEDKSISIERLPYCLRILLENLLRHCCIGNVQPEEVYHLARWRPGNKSSSISFMPSRVVMQDFTGVPAVVDLAAMRSAVARAGSNPDKVNPLVPVDLVIDHSVQVDYFATAQAQELNVHKEITRNSERYTLLRWAQKAFKNFNVVPPGAGIVHQVNLEYFSSLVEIREINGEKTAFPDTLVGTDSHTTMINSLGVLGWGVGGIEAEAVLLGQPYSMLIPDVVGIKVTGELPEKATATDLVLTIAEMLRKKGVVGRFVEFFGPGLKNLGLPDRATVSNMSPEFGATATFFPVDDETLKYLTLSGRSKESVTTVERYCREQQLFHHDDSPEPDYKVVYDIDLAEIRPCVAGPRKPQERIVLSSMKEAFSKSLKEMISSGVTVEPDDYMTCGCWAEEGGSCRVVPTACSCSRDIPFCHCSAVEINEQKVELSDGSVVIAAITSCTNTSNPWVMVGAGLLARNAVKRGLKTKPWVKTSMAPGSTVVTEYLTQSGLMPYLEALGFHVVGYGCTTCIGNSGPLPEIIAKTIESHNLVAAAVLSGNRNFEARIHPYVRANFLASPPLVVAYALSGTVNKNLTDEPLASDPNGNPVFLNDIWPDSREIDDIIKRFINPQVYTDCYSSLFEGEENWKSLSVPEAGLYEWSHDSTYIQEPPFFMNLSAEPQPLSDIKEARIFALFGDTLTTDHISPAGTISEDSPAGQYLISQDVKAGDFNSFGSRRGNHHVMIRGTFGNIRIRNTMVQREGGWTVYYPEGKEMTFYDASMLYQKEGIPLVVFAGKDYGTGSSRDWAAKGTYLLGVKAVIAESFERIHRSNLLGMGVLPLQFEQGTTIASLEFTGEEVISLIGIEKGLTPGCQIDLLITKKGSNSPEVHKVIVRLDNDIEIDYYRHGGILQKVFRQLVTQESAS